METGATVGALYGGLTAHAATDAARRINRM
jgi:hypothetical protein